MNITSIISFLMKIGISLSPILVYYSVFHIIKGIAKKKEKKLSLICDKCLTIIDPNISCLGININNIPEKSSKKRIIYFKACFKNLGKRDVRIDKESVPIFISCGDSFKWLNIAIIKNPKNCKCDIRVETDCKLSVRWDLLKRGETIHFQGLAEILGKKKKEDTLRFFNSLEIESRIDDVPPITKNLCNEDEPIVSEYRSRIESTQVIFMGILMCVLGLFAYFFTPDNTEVDLDKVYMPVISVEQNYNNLTKEVTLSALKDSLIVTGVVDNDEFGESKKITVTDFNRLYSINGVARVRSPQKKYITLFVFYMGLFLIVSNFIWSQIRRWRLKKKYKQ